MRILARIIISAAVLSYAALPLCAQKRTLDHDVFDSWKSVSSNAVSADGDIITYEINPQEGDGILYVRRLSDGRSLEIERGSGAEISRDGHWMFLRIKVPFQATRKARIAKKSADKMPKDTIAFVNLDDFTLTRLGEFSTRRTSVDGTPLMAYETGKKKVLIVFNPASGRSDTLANAESFRFDRTGTRLAVVFKKDREDSLSRNEVALYRTENMVKTSLAEGAAFYSVPTFNRNGDRLLFLASTDSADTGGKYCSLHMTQERVVGKGGKARRTVGTDELIPQGYAEGLPSGKFITAQSDPVFSKDGSRVFLNLCECLPPDDTTLVSFETAGLDIWNWDIYMTPPMQKANAGKIAKAGCMAAIDLQDPHRLITISVAPEEKVSPVRGGEADWALVTDTRPYDIRGTWDGNNLHDVYKVSLKDGGRTPLFTALNGNPSVSPDGRFICWFSGDDLNWYSYAVSDGKVTNLTGGLDGVFFNDEDDHPDVKPATDRPHWMDGDRAFFLADKFDIWKISPDGSRAENMTLGAGRSANVQYRYDALVPSDITAEEKRVGVTRTVSARETVHLTTFDRTSKERGFATLRADKAGLTSSFTAPFTFRNTVHSLNSPVVCYTKGNFNNPMDLYVSRDYWRSETRMTDLKPQQDACNWGNVRLVHWNAYDGTPLDGLLYTPEDLDPDGKYPMIVYFYEKNSQELYTAYNPVPSRSVINYPFYTSRGYVVFVPDIVYKDGHPGESAFNCICSGAEAMCAQFGFIDSGRMGLQGQSWGGYQTAYLVTRTNMFAAAGAGAPVGNMTSAYGGIRWGSGVVRAVQYEHGQSRIGKSMWEPGGLELYIENSPVFHTRNVTTPVLIMHNDGDGAVPWYQGIEFFMALRRFGHPAWLLQYNGEEHNLVERRNTKDLTRRLQQFFDHYLKGAPMPAWMSDGVPYNRKGQYFGFEYPEERK